MSVSEISLHPLKKEDLPKSWKLVPVAKVLLESQYGTNAAPNAAGCTAVIGMKNIQDGRILMDDLVYADLEGEEKEKYLLNKDDILINRTNSYDLVGKVGIYTSEIEAAFASYLVRLKINKDKVLPEFLNYWLNGYVAQKTIKRIATKAISQANINPTEFKKHCYIPLPPITEQKDIIKVLKTVDSAIELSEKLILEKTKQKKELSRSMFSQEIRLKGFSEPWSVFRLGDLFKERNERGYCDLPLLSITRKDGVIPREGVNRKDTSNEDKSKYLRICVGDIGYNTMRMWQGVSALSQYEGIVSPAYTICIPDSRIDGEFASYYFKTTKLIHLFYRYSQGLTSDTWNLKFKHFSEIKIAIPEIEEQKEISEIFKTFDQEINLIQKELDAYKKQKVGLVQRLLIGEWRVSGNKEVA